MQFSNKAKNKCFKILPIQAFVHFDDIIQFFAFGREKKYLTSVKDCPESKGRFTLKQPFLSFLKRNILAPFNTYENPVYPSVLLSNTFLQGIFLSLSTE